MMDPNDQVPLDYPQTIVNNSPSDFNDGFDFLSELFENSPAEDELSQASHLNSDYQEAIDVLVNNVLTPNSDNFQKNEDSGKEHSSLFAEFSKENEKRKCAIKRLKKKILARQSKMANYEVKLARSMTDLVAANKELEELRKAKIFYETENEKLDCHVKQLKCVISQYEQLKLRDNEENLKIKELEKEITNKMNSIRRLKKNSAAYRSQLAKKDIELKKQQHHNKQVWCLLVEFGNKLENVGLLTESFKMDIMKKYDCLSLEKSKTKGGKDDFSEIVSAVFNNSFKLAGEVDSDNFNICIGDQNVISSMLSPISSSASNIEIEASSDSRSMDIFQTEFHNLSKKKNKSKENLSDNSNAEEDENWDLCSSPESLNFDEEVHSCDKEEKQMSISSPLHDSYTNVTKNFFKVNDHSVSSIISRPLSKFNERVFTGSQSVQITPNSDLTDLMPILKNFQSSYEITVPDPVPEGCELENTSLSKQDFQSIKPLEEIISAEKCKSLDTFQAGIHNLSKKKNKSKKKISYKNNSEEDQDWNLCSSPDTSNSGKEIHSHDEEEIIISSPLHDSYVNDANKSWKLKSHFVSSSINQPLSKIDEQVFTGSQSVEVTPCSDTDTTDMGSTLSMPVLWNSRIYGETNMSVPTFEESQPVNNLPSKQDSLSIQPEIFSTERFKSMNICDSSELNQKIFERDLKSFKNSTDPIVLCNNSQADEADSNEESDFLEVKDMQSDSCAEGAKDFPKTLNVTSAVLSKNLTTEICEKIFESVGTNISTNNQNINLSALSSLPSFQPRNEVTSSNNSSTVSYQNELISNFSTKQERSKKKLLVSSFSDDAKQDRFCEFLPGSITSEKDERSPNKQQTVGSILLQKQNSYANQEENLFRMKEVSSSNNILMSLKNPIQEKKTKECIEQAFSVDALSEAGSLSAVSMPLLKHSPGEELNFCTTPGIVLKNKALLEQSPKKELRKLTINENNTSNVSLGRTALKNEISSYNSANNLIAVSEFESGKKGTSVFQDDQSLPGDRNFGSDEFSKFENLLNMLLNPLSPLPPSPGKNSKFFLDESILNSNLKELGENLQANQISSLPKLVEDQELLIDKNRNLYCVKGNLLQAGTSISHKNDCFVIESHNNLEVDTQPKFLEQCSSVHGNIIKSLVSEKQDATSDVLYPKIHPCFVLLSRDDVPSYFSSLRKQTSSRMLTYNQNNCESLIPESSNLIASPETDDLLLNDNNKVVINTSNILKFNSSQHKTELKNSKLSQEFSLNKSEFEFQIDTSIKRPFIDSKTKITTSHSSLLNLNASPNSLIEASPVVAVFDCKHRGDSIHDLTESENLPPSLHSPKSTLKVSVSNATKSSSNQKHILSRTSENIQNLCVLLSKNDIPNYFHCLKNKSSFQGNKCNQIKFDCLNSKVCRYDILSSNDQLEKLSTHDNLSTPVATNGRTMSDSVCCGIETTEIKKSLLSTHTFSDNESNIRPGHEISPVKPFDVLNVKNVTSPFSPMALTKSLDFFKQQPLNDDINAAKDHNAYLESENCFETNSSKFIADEASLNVIKSSTSRKQNISSGPLTSKTQECYVSLSKSDVPNYFQNLRNKTPSQIVDYYNSHLTNSAHKNSSSVISFEMKDNDFFLIGDCKASAEIKSFKKISSNDMQYEDEKISNLSAAEIFFEKESNCKFSHGGLLEEPSNLSKTKIIVPSFSFQPVLSSPNLVEDSSLNTALDPVGFVKNLSLTEHKKFYELSNEQGNISKDISLSNMMTSSAKEQEIPSKLLSENIRKCFVYLSRSDIPNYFLSLKKESMSQTTELNQTNFTNLISSVEINKREQTASSDMNDNNTTFIDKDCELNIDCDSIHHKGEEVGINLFFIPTDQKNESNSGFCQEILSDKAFNLMREKTFVLPAESEKLVSHFNIIQNFNKNYFKSQSLPTIKNYCSPSDDDSDRIIPMNKTLTAAISQNSSSAEICHEGFSTKPLKLPINYLEENPFESSMFQNCSANIVNSSNQNTFKSSISHNSPLRGNNAPSLDVIKNTDRVESVNKKVTVPFSQNSSDIEIFHEDLAANPVELPISHLNQNSFKSAMSQNCSANPMKLLVNNVDQNASKSSMSQNSFWVENHVPSLDANDTTDKVEPVNKKLTVQPFQDSSDTEIFHGDLSADFVELPVKSQYQKCPIKRKRPASADCNFSEKTSIKKQFRNFTLSKPLDKEKRTTILLPGPSMSTKWKKSSIINRLSLPNKQKRIQPEIPIPAYTTSGFQKKCSSTFKKKHTSIRDSLKKTIKPIDSEITCAAPVRVRGRTSKSKVFFKSSCSRLINNNIDSNCDINKLADNGLMSHEHDEKIENYISVKPQKIRKQHGKISVDNGNKADTLLANARSRKSMNFISFVKGKDLKDESIELCSSSMKSRPDSNNSDKCVPTKSECFIYKKRPLNSDIESVMKKQNCSRSSESTIANSSSSKNIPSLNENFSANYNSLSKTIEDDQHLENDSDRELIINESDNETPGTCNNSVDEHFQKTSEKLLNGKSSCPDLLEESYSFDKNSYNFNFKNIIPSDTNETNGNKLLLPTKSSRDSAEMLSSNKSDSPSLDKIPSESIVSNISISSETNCKNFSVTAAATSKIVAKTNSHKNETSITIPGTSKIATTSNLLYKSSAALKFSKETTKNDHKKTFINKRNRKSYHTKFMEEKRCKSSKLEAVFPFSVHIGEILDGMNNTSVDQLVFKKCVHSLTNFLINPKNAPDTATLIFLVVHYLHLKQDNPLLKFLESPESYPFFLPSEDCVVTALLNIEKKNKSHLQGLVNSLLSVMYNLILEKKKLNLYGMSSLCRVFTELCKRNGDEQKPLFLCCDLLKQKYQKSPFLIASIAGVWKELFKIPDNFSDEKRILFSSIAYGAQKRPKKVKKSWKNISKLIAEYFVVPSVPDAKQVIKFLKEQIVSKSLQGSFENSQYLTSSLVILAAHEPWDWTNQTLLNDYIVMNLKRFSSQDLNEQAFDLFCDLYVDVYLLAPTKLADTVLIKFVEDKVECKEKLYVKSCAAAALMKYVILAKREIPVSLTVFFKNNSEHPKVKLLADMVQRRILSTCMDKLSAEDIMISTQ